jgi:predicted phage terminase large subunit-like protein
MDLSRYSDTELAEMVLLLERRQEFEQLSVGEQLHLERKAQLEASPAEFFYAAWNVLEPGRPLSRSWHYDLLGEYLLRVYQRKTTRLIINVPPRTAKSTFVTICFPAWVWARDQKHRFLTASYSSDLSREHSSKRRLLIESPWFRSFWPVEFSRDTNRADQYRNSENGEMIATSVGATGTGRGGDTLILDDGLGADQAASEAARKEAHRWFTDTFRSRLNNPATGAIVVVEQRTHHEDVTGWVITNEPGQWTHVSIPLVQDEKRDVEIEFPVSGRKMERKVGDVLQPDRHTPEVIASQRVHRRTFETQAQQRPSPEGGDICKREWWQFYKALPDEFDLVLDSWDLSFKDVKTADSVSGFKVGTKGAKRFFIACKHGRMGFTASCQAIQMLAGQTPHPSRILIEDKANGPAVIDSLKDKVPGILPVEPAGSKFARAVAATGDIEAGNCYLPDLDVYPQHREWVDSLIEQWAIFPNGPNDDDVDASDQAINYTRSGMASVFGFYQEQNAEAAAKVEAAKAPKIIIKPRDWSESIRTVGMCVTPSAMPDEVELVQWAEFCEEQGQTERAQFARALLETKGR